MFGMLPFERGNDNLFDAFDRFERQFFGNTRATLPDFRTDIRETDGQYVLDAELPGFNKEDIHLDLKDGILTISAEHREDKEEKDAKGNFIRRERRCGSFSRSFDVTGIDVENISASYNNGVLELTLPKQVPAIPESRRIAIE